MPNITFKPLLVEPKWRNISSRCNVRASYDRAFKLLDKELRLIDAINAVVEAGFTDQQIRRNGMPYGTERPRFATVRVTCKKAGKPLSFVCGGHEQWVQNVYLIGMTLASLRAVDRYGCVQGGEQYEGFSQLPPGRGPIEAAEWPSQDEARRWMMGIAETTTQDTLDGRYRQAARKAHPDAGGSTELMAKVNRARDYIGNN